MRQTTKKLTARICTAAAVLICGAALPVTAYANSVEDVYDAMRRIGLPESMVQEAKIQYQNTEHDSDGMEINGTYLTYDVWADMVEIYEDDIRAEVGKQFGVSGDAIKQAAEEDRTQAQQPAQTAPQSGNSSAPAETNAAKQEQPAKPAVSVEPEKPFVNMTLTEKKEYVASLPEEERAGFIAGLTTSERNSVIKQMSTGSQANIANGFIQLGEQLGMHISVDQLDGSGINYSVRNSEGTLIDVSSVGTTVDDTGWNTTVPVLAGTAMILGAAGGLILAARRQRKEEQEA